MKKNLLLVIVIGFIVILGFSAFKNSTEVATNGEDADFYADAQLAAQAGCTTSTTPVISNVQVTSLTQTSAVVTWTTNIVSDTRLKIGTSSSSMVWKPTLDQSGVINHSYAVQNLTPNKKYYYRVRSASVPGGCTKTTSTYNFTTLSSGGSTVPPTPTALSATNLSCNALTLSWAPSSGATGYEVYGPNGACNVNGSAGYCGSTTTATTLGISGLAPLTTYSGATGSTAGFTVLAFNSAGYSPSATRLAVTTPSCGSADTIAPTTTTAAPSAAWSNTTLSRTLSCADNTGGSGCSATYWQFVTQGTTCPLTGSASYTASTSALTSTQGQWRLCYYSKDVANNIENPAKYQEAYKLDTGAPTGSIATPTTGSTLSGTTTIAVSASDALSGVASVAFKVDGTTVNTDTTSPWSYAWDTTTATNGTHTISATITDIAGNSTATSSVSVTVSNSTATVPPTPTGLSASSLSCTAFTLTWNASATATSYEVYGPSSATSCPSGTCGITSATSLAISGLLPSTTYSGATGANAGFTVLARNAIGYSPAATRLAVTTPACSNTAPVITITTPTTATTYTATGSSVILGGTATDNVSVSSVTWQNQTNSTSGTATGTSSWSTGSITLASGANTLVVTATDNQGATSTDTITVTYTPVGNQAPVATITTPTTATTYATTTNTLSLSGTATDDVSVSGVSFINQTTGFSGNASGTSSWSTSSIPLALGANVIIVTATDGAGLTGTDTITVTYSVASQANAWPTTATGTEIGAGLVSSYEPSGAFWNPADQKLYFVSDSGVITQMDQNGANAVNWTVGGNLEAITGTSTYNLSTLNYLYVVDEATSTVKEFNPATGAFTPKSWVIATSAVPTDIPNNNGIEGIAFVPNAKLPAGYGTSTSGGMFYLSSQSTGKVYVLNINLSTSGTVSSAVASITPSLMTTGSATDIADLYYAVATNKLFVLYDTLNVVHEMRPNGLIVNEYMLPAASSSLGQEAVTTVPTCNASATAIVLGYDDGGSTHHLYKYSNYPQPCADGGDITGPTISNVQVTNITTSGATVTWDTNEYADTALDYGIGNYNSNIGTIVTLKTTGHIVGLSGLTAGSTYQFRPTSKDQHGNSTQSTSTFTTLGAGVDPYIVAAGDISTTSTGDTQTSNYIINSLAAATSVLALGDDAYDNGTYAEFMANYDPTWGRTAIITKTRPVPGNHEYNVGPLLSPNGSCLSDCDSSADPAYGYFTYYQNKGLNVGRGTSRTAEGYYSYNVGTWHIVALNTNSECGFVSCAAGSAQEQWLRQDLAANPSTCSLAYFHHPRFTSGSQHSSSTATQPLWKAFQDFGGDVVLAGHVHNYERFAPQTSNGTGGTGTADANGIREFVVGTGGTNNWYAPGSPIANSVIQIGSTYGVLKLTLHPSSYDWQFIRTSDGLVQDSGTGSCH
jgi:hypothetical protein